MSLAAGCCRCRSQGSTPGALARTIRHAWLTEVIGQVHGPQRRLRRPPGPRRAHPGTRAGRGPQGRRAAHAPRGVVGAARQPPLPPTSRHPDRGGPWVDRQFARGEPDRLWVTDIAEHPTREGKVYRARWRGTPAPAGWWAGRSGAGLVDRQHPDGGAGDQRAGHGVDLVGSPCLRAPPGESTTA